ncbi:uncharacterized protein LOC141684992 [Apium graveolens]|uniref:uncharacterized protein LOC141684992 n=1 Tax=Apium graveolens TaxID=4045 RepID=UPI003D79A5F3
MEMHGFNIILGMDWLSEHRAIVDCQGKKVIFRDADKPKFVYQGTQPKGEVKSLKANKLLSKGCDGYLAFVKDTSKDEPYIMDFPVVKEYADVFPDELSGLPPHRKVEFTIELVPVDEPISKTPYRMVPLQLQGLKEQLQELLNRGFIRPSVSPWGAPVLFVKKKDDLPLTRLMRKGIKFEWSDDCVKSFQELKKRLVSAPILVLPSGSGGFQRDIVRLYGMPMSILSDRDTRFKSCFWKGFQQAWGTRLNFSTAYHPQTDGQLEDILIQTLEDMLMACALEWTCGWDKYLYLVEFAYNSSWDASIGMPPFESLYGRRCRESSCWDEIDERVIEGPDLFGGYEPGDHEFLKVSPCKGVKHFGMKEKLSSRNVGPFDVMEKVGEVSYRVVLSPQLSHVHNVFHVSVLRGYKYHPLHVVQYPLHKIREDLSCEEEAEAIIA